MKNVTADIAKQITKYRLKVGLNKKELSKIVGVAPSTVSGWENAEYAPGADTLVRLCDYFDITLDEIYGIEIIEKAPEITPEGRYKDIIEMLDTLCPEQIGEVRGYIKRMIHENEAAGASKQINGELA